MKKMKIYVASSWRNEYQPDVVNKLRELGHEVYDFRNPPKSTGFAWSQIDENWEDWTTDEYKNALKHPIAIKGFNSDFDGMKWADCCVMVLPCGRSANTEAGWCKGAGKKVYVYQPIEQEPELMYNLYDGILGSMEELIDTFRYRLDEGSIGPQGWQYPSDPTHSNLQLATGFQSPSLGSQGVYSGDIYSQPKGKYGPNDDGYMTIAIRKIAEQLVNTTANYPGYAGSQILTNNHHLVKALKELAMYDKQICKYANLEHEQVLFTPIYHQKQINDLWNKFEKFELIIDDVKSRNDFLEIVKILLETHFTEVDFFEKLIENCYKKLKK